MPKEDTEQNEFLQPLGSPVDNTDKQEKRVPWEWGIRQGIQMKRIRTSAMYFKNMFALGSNGTLLGTMNMGTIGSVGTVIIDNINNRILINDGTVNVILLGRQVGGF